MAKEVKIKRFKKPQRSPIQWNEGAGEYEAKCGACGKMVYSPTLDLMSKIHLQHTRSKDCLGGY
jgi:hypothetical protein